jgi:hypothetical protein
MFDQMLERLQNIKLLPDHRTCALVLEGDGRGSISNHIKETLYFEDEDGLITEELSWTNDNEAIEKLDRYLTIWRAKERFYAKKHGEKYCVWDSQKERIHVIQDRECIFSNPDLARKSCKSHNRNEEVYQKVKHRLATDPEAVDQLMRRHLSK